MGFGDEILAAGQAQQLYDADMAQRPVAILDQHGRLRSHPIWQGNPAIAVAPGAPQQQLVNCAGHRPYLVDQPMTPDGGWKFNRTFRARDHIAKIYLTEEEWHLGTAVAAEHGAYVLIDPYSAHPNLRWPLEHWETLVAMRPDLTFVQQIHQWSSSYLVPGAVPIDTPTFRAACGVLASADCYIRGESGMLHAAAALGVPSVAIWGECMDWEVLGGYPLQVGVGISAPACGMYYPCVHCAAIMHAITPEDVGQAIGQAVRWAGKITLQ